MSESEKQTIVDTDVPTIVDERHETSEPAIEQTAGPSTRPDCSGEQAGLGRDDSHRKAAALETGNLKLETATGAALETGNLKHETATGDALETGNLKLETVTELCHHVMESGIYCQSPALRGRRYCYSHLRIRGQRIRIARALAQRQAWKLVLPPLDDMNSVLAALGQVADGLAAGLLPPRQADLLLYTLRQAAAALRWVARSQAGSIRPLTAALPPQAGDGASAALAGAPPSSPDFGERVGSDGEQKRLVEEYAGFEAEFGLPVGLDLSQPEHVLFPPAAPTWPSATGTAGSAQPVAYNDPPRPRPLWTKESIELEELDKRREHMSEKSFNEQSCKIHAHIEKQVKTEVRQEREAEWQAEADRRNAREEKKAQILREMDDGQRRTFQLGISEGIEIAKRDAEEEARNRKPPKADVEGSRVVGMGRVDSR